MDTTPVQSTSLTSEQTIQIRKLHQEAKEAQKLGNRALALEKLREVKAVLDAPDTAPSSVKTSSSPPDTSPSSPDTSPAKEALSDPFASLPLAPSSPPSPKEDWSEFKTDDGER